MSNLNPKYKLFAEEYIQNGFKAKQAAISAGYSQRSAHVTATRLIKNADVLEYIKKRIRELLSETEQLTMRWVDRVTFIAFSDPNAMFNKHGDEYGVDYSNQLKALDLLAKYLALYSDIELKAAPEDPVKAMTKEQRRNRILELSAKLNGAR